MSIDHTEIETMLGRELSEAEKLRVDYLYPSYLNILELALNHVLERRIFVETQWTDAIGSPVRLFKGPVCEVLQVRRVIDNYGTLEDVSLTGYRRVGDVVYLGGGYQQYEVTYVAGDEALHPGVRFALVQALSRTLSTPSIVATGAISSYSVEGTSISYDTGRTSPGTPAPFHDEEFLALSGLRRLSFD